MTTPIARLGRLFLGAFALVAATLGYWAIAARGDLLARQDNPRNVLAEQQIQRGLILDRNDLILAETTYNADGLAVRSYPHPETASAIGYYSLRYGVGGIEAESDPILRGTQFLNPEQTLIDRALHRPLVGGDVRLTLDLITQRAAASAMNGRNGAVVALNAVSGDVLALVSEPSFDPSTLDEQWDTLTADPDSPLLNRATQGLYQPGTAFLPITLGEALNAGLASPETSWEGDPEARIDSVALPCANNPPAPIAQFGAAFVWGCPGPYQTLGAQIGSKALITGLDDFGLREAVPFDLPTIATANNILDVDPALLAVGQSNVTVTPLQMALVAAAFANHGQMPAPRLITATRPPSGDWSPTTALGLARGTISPTNADKVAALMRQSVQRGAAWAANTDSATIAGICGLAISGPGHSFDTWFMGYGEYSGKARIAIAVLLEDQKDCALAARVGRDVLLAAVGSDS